MATSPSFAQFFDIDFWREMNPDLSISMTPFRSKPRTLSVTPEQMQTYARQLAVEGHFRIESVISRPDIEKLVTAVKNIVQLGIPPAFAYVYDEFWSLLNDLSPVLTPTFGDGYKIAAQMWAWHISGNSAGFQPHRDTANMQTLRDDGMPWFGTIWIPLTDVTTLHSCMHVLPQNHDVHLPANIEKSSIPEESIVNIHALPAPAGSILCWNPVLLHWGSRGNELAAEPRISIAASIIRREVTSILSYERHPDLTIPFRYRLGLLSNATLHYQKQTINPIRYSDEIIEICTNIIGQPLPLPSMHATA